MQVYIGTFFTENAQDLTKEQKQYVKEKLCTKLYNDVAVYLYG